MMRKRLIRSGLWVGVGLLLLPLAAGCRPATAHVTGKVLYKGQPLPGGAIQFWPANGQGSPASATIGEDGSYDVAKAPVGEVKITVDNRALKNPEAGSTAVPNTPKGAAAAQPGGMPPEVRKQLEEHASSKNKPVGKYVHIPDKYASAGTTPLDFTITGGKQEHDISLQ